MENFKVKKETLSDESLDVVSGGEPLFIAYSAAEITALIRAGYKVEMEEDYVRSRWCDDFLSRDETTIPCKIFKDGKEVPWTPTGEIHAICQDVYKKRQEALWEKRK